MSLSSSPVVGALLLTLVSALTVSGVRTAAQSGTNLERPPTWRVRYDLAGSNERVHLVMRPGWHINPGPAAVFWDPGRFASGSFSVTSTIFLFPAGQGDPPSRADGPYGLVAGGSGLDGPTPSYAAFLIRNDGRFLVTDHRNGQPRDLVGWTAHKAIAVWAEGAEGAAKNVLAVDVREDAVTFFVNDESVASIPRSTLRLEGLVGLRAGDGLSLHVTDIAIGPNRR